MCRSIRIANGASFGPLGQDRVDDEQPRVRGHRGTADGEDAAAVLVVPVVQDAREQVGVRARGHGVEEVAVDAGGVDVRARRLDRAGAVDERGLEVRRRLEDRREQDAAAAADVDQARQAAKS